MTIVDHPALAAARAEAAAASLDTLDMSDASRFQNDTIWPYFERLRGEAPVHYCANSPVYRDYTRRIVAQLAGHFGSHPSVIGWQTDNEFGCHDTARCYCDNCLQTWHHWLRSWRRWAEAGSPVRSSASTAGSRWSDERKHRAERRSGGRYGTG